jgi:glucosamine 6-phosphate synthetase-like amidotransferase/phosphosugar isomerase protein
MLKEIHEQPRAIEDTLRGRITLESGELEPQEMGITAEQARRRSSAWSFSRAARATTRRCTGGTSSSPSRGWGR